MTSYPCPACGGDAVLCSCDALPLEDQRLLVDALKPRDDVTLVQ